MEVLHKIQVSYFYAANAHNRILRSKKKIDKLLAIAKEYGKKVMEYSKITMLLAFSLSLSLSPFHSQNRMENIRIRNEKKRIHIIFSLCKVLFVYFDIFFISHALSFFISSAFLCACMPVHFEFFFLFTRIFVVTLNWN